MFGWHVFKHPKYLSDYNLSTPVEIYRHPSISLTGGPTASSCMKSSLSVLNLFVTLHSGNIPAEIARTITN